jgi:chaperonin cofactor prefoldin
MKLAEALILRADSQKRVEQLRQRLTRAARVQEGENPPENPQELMAELDQIINEITTLIKRINKTNAHTNLADNLTLADALANRDTLLLKRNVYNALVETAAHRQDRYSLSEIKFVSTVNVALIQAQVDQLSRQYRELDTKIQEANWKTELLD